MVKFKFTLKVHLTKKKDNSVCVCMGTLEFLFCFFKTSLLEKY